MDSSNKKNEQGFLMLDVLIGLFIASIITMAFLGSVVGAVRYTNLQTKAVQAEFLAIELLEVARELEVSSNWNDLSTGICAQDGVECHPEVKDGAWELVDDTETIGVFTRSISLVVAERDASFALADSGTPDSSTLKAIATVAWSAYNSPRLLILETYLYDHP